MNGATMKSRNYSAVIVDDDPISRQLFEVLARDIVSQITCFSNAEDALSYIEEHSCHLLITDYTLAKMNGIELLNHIHNISPDSPVILTSKYNKKSLLLEALKLGVFDFIEKPINGERFKSAVSLALNFGNASSENNEGQPLMQKHKAVRKNGILDTEALIKQFQGDHATVVDIYTTFLHFSDSSIKKLRQTLKDGNLQDFSEVAQTLQSTMSNLYVYDAEIIMDQIIDAINSQQSPVASDVEQLSTEFEQIRKEIELFIQKKPV